MKVSPWSVWIEILLHHCWDYKCHLSLPETGASLGKAVLEQFYATDILKNWFIHEANLITVGVETFQGVVSVLLLWGNSVIRSHMRGKSSR